VHTVSGKHIAEEIAFPDWVPKEVIAQAATLDEKSAFDQLGRRYRTGIPIRKAAPRKRRSR
jgi:hypothetical protein